MFGTRRRETATDNRPVERDEREVVAERTDGPRRTYGLTRALMTLLGAGAAGLLIWLATRIHDDTNGGYWAVYGLLAAAGLCLALSQLLGGWTKWGWPRISGAVFLLGFLPTLVVGGWIVAAHQPDPNWFRSHVVSWSGDLGISGFVNDMKEYVSAIALGIGVVFGFTFDTTGPRRATTVGRRRRTAASPTTRDAPPSDEPTTAERRERDRAEADPDEVERDETARERDGELAGSRGRATPAPPEPEPPPRAGEPD
jgi:hypothetical protein